MKRLLAGSGRDDIEALCLEHAAEQVMGMRVIIDHEDRSGRTFSCRSRGACRRCRLGARRIDDAWEAHREGRAFAGRAGQLDVAAHHAAQLPADRQAQAGAAVVVRRGRFGLRERVKRRFRLLGAHADPIVGDGELDHLAAGRLQTDAPKSGCCHPSRTWKRC
jgi:hypothetical protein